MTINILGTDYLFTVRKYSEDPCFANENIDGYHDGPARIMVVCDLSTHPAYAKESASHCEEQQNEIARHEIVHAFLFQSGLGASSGVTGNGWALNEEMVDWFAMQGLKIYAAWKQVGAIQHIGNQEFFTKEAADSAGEGAT